MQAVSIGGIYSHSHGSLTLIRDKVKKAGVGVCDSAERQKNFKGHGIVRTPRIFRIDRVRGYALMEYADGCHPLEAESGWIANPAHLWVRRNLESSVNAPFPFSDVMQKIDGVAQSLRESGSDGVKECGIVRDMVNDYAPPSIPTGQLHGDLTLCNMLHNGRSLALLDFGRVLIQSPLYDVAKMEQDITLGWSLTLNPKLRGRESSRIAKDELAQHLPLYESYGYTKQVRFMLIAIALVRMLPYGRTKGTGFERSGIAMCAKEAR